MRWNKIFTQRIFFQSPALEELKKSYLLMDMHVHTRYSHDSKTKVSDLLKIAEQKGIGFAVTDHLQVQGAIDACKQKKVPVIPGIEIASIEDKEIIFYFYRVKDLADFYSRYIEHHKVVEKAPKNRIQRSLVSVRSKLTMAELVERAGKDNCVKCVPHPYTYLWRSSHKFFEKSSMMKKIDAIETVNSSIRPSRNKKATFWALKMKKAFTAGSDAHTATELGRSVVAARAKNIGEFLDSVKNKQGIIMGNEMKRREAIKNILSIANTKRKKKW
jgi:predicted metal-dependent phosphoesterase TrpH